MTSANDETTYVPQLERIFTGTQTRRYHGKPLIQQQNIADHSANVALIIMVLEPDCSANLLKAALLHDLAEDVVGDIPAPSKRKLNIRQVVQDYEDDVMEAAGFEELKLTSREIALLKLADALDGVQFCTREMMLGNTLIISVAHTFQRYAWELVELPGTEPRYSAIAYYFTNRCGEELKRHGYCE